MKIIINTDGAARGNPGPASYGFVIRNEEGKVIYEEGKAIGVDTNNVAEYTAVLRAFEYLISLDKRDFDEVRVLADSQLIVRQLSGIYKIKNLKLKQLYEKIKILEFDLPPVSYDSIPREENSLADAMANLALDRE